MNKNFLKVLSIFTLSINVLALLFLVVSLCISFFKVDFMGMSHFIVLIVVVAIDIFYIIFSLIVRWVKTNK